MSLLQHTKTRLRLACAICAGGVALVPAQFASAIYVDTTPPTFTALPGATTLPNPAPTYEQPVYVFNLASDPVGDAGIVPLAAGPTVGKVNVDDGDAGNTSWTPTGKMGPFAPGTHTVTWKATDLALNSVTGTQTVTVLPHVNTSVDQTVGEGGIVIITVYLNGNAPAGGINIPYTITGTATSGVDYTAVGGGCSLLSGTLTIPVLANKASCQFNVINDGLGDPNETIIFTIETNQANLNTANGNAKVVLPGNKSVHTVTITETNFPPAAELAASQGGVTHTIVTTAGNVTVTPTVSDPNPGDTFSYNWSGSDASLVSAATNGTTNNTFIFNPTGLTPGFYTASLTVTDNHGASSRRDLTLSVIATAPTLSTTADSDDDDIVDNSDGYRDADNDGIPDYLDAVSASYLLQGDDLPSLSSETYVSELTDSRNNISGTFNINWTITTAASNKVFYPRLLRTTPGLKLQLGPLAIRQNVHQAHISAATAIAALGVDPGAGFISADGSILDVEISGLSPGGTAQLVIPQPAPIPAATGTPATTNFRLFTTSNTWGDFSSTGGSSIKYINKVNSFCAPPGHSDYSNNADSAPGKECVQLTIVDGGPDDADGIVNGSVRVLGAVFISTSDTTSSSGLITTPGDISASNVQKYKNNAGEGGGGGALCWEILLLLPLFRRSKLKV